MEAKQMAMDIPTCPLCGGTQPMEHDVDCNDWACFECGLAAPVDVLENIVLLGNRNALLEGDFERFHAGKNDRIAELEAELARLKQPAHVLAEAERLLREAGVDKVSLLEIEAKLPGKLAVVLETISPASTTNARTLEAAVPYHMQGPRLIRALRSTGDG